MRLSRVIPGPLGLLFLAAGLSALTMLDGIQPNDEGLMLQAAARIADGQVPYSDFWWFYPPGQPYLLGALWAAFGPSLLSWRIVRVLTDAAVAVLVWLLARRGAPGDAAGPPPAGLALAAWLAAAGAMAVPSGPHPFPPTLAFALGALLLFERSPAWAGLLTGLAAVWRLEFAAYLALGVLLAYALAPQNAAPGGSRARAAARYAAAAVAAALALYAPVVLRAGLGDSFELLVRYPLFDFQEYQSLPFPIDYDGPLNTSSVGGFLTDSAENIVHFYVPLAVLMGLAGALAALVLRFRRERSWPLVTTVVFSLGMAHYLLVRPDLFHAQPPAVMLCVLAAWALAGVRLRPVRLALVPAALCALGFAWVLAEGVDRRVRGVEENTVALDLPVADGARTRPARAAPLEDAVRYVQGRVREGEPVYVATRRSDLVTSGHPLFYVLVERRNPTRYDIQAPGVVTSAPVQREIVADLERTRTPAVVRFAAPITAEPEPNRAGESSGVTILDDYLARRYRESARFGFYVVLERRA